MSYNHHAFSYVQLDEREKKKLAIVTGTAARLLEVIEQLPNNQYRESALLQIEQAVFMSKRAVQFEKSSCRHSDVTMTSQGRGGDE